MPVSDTDLKQPKANAGIHIWPIRHHVNNRDVCMPSLHPKLKDITEYERMCEVYDYIIFGNTLER